MKVYDKEIYQKQESIKYTVIIIFVFLLGFIVGYLSNSIPTSTQENINEIRVETVN